jgi:Tol biopolymer transport system component
VTDAAPRLSAALADRYRIERELGQGGMATVYLAQDLRHHRQVAIKVLRPELAAVLGAERFVQEITTTAQLQHPHILPLFDSGQADGFLYYVMPYVEGETLRDKLNRETQLGVEEAVRIATEVADALDYAHRHGVIHRDIKPENILLHDGRATVADFGIALALSAAAGGRMTETGMSLGTPHYMSPEQATAEKDPTNRSDIYSLGCVLYEMLTGNPPHVGATAQQIIMKIVTEEAAPVAAARKSVPANVAAAVGKALEKLPADRFGSAAEFAQALTDSHFTAGPALALEGSAPAMPVGRAGARRALLPWALVGISVAIIALLGTLLARRPSAPASGIVRAVVELPAGTSLAGAEVVLSRDGRRIAVVGTQREHRVIFQRALDQSDFAPVPGTEGAMSPVLSPDGKWVAFFSGGAGAKLRKVPVDGGPVVDIAEGSFGGGAWADDGTIVYTKDYTSGLWTVPAGGGTPRMLTTPDSLRGELGDWWPQVLPDGDHVLFTAYTSPVARARIEVVSRRSGDRKVLVEGGVFGRYLPPGYLLYARDGTLFAVAFDARRLEVGGQPVPVAQGVAMESASGEAAYAVSDDGMLAYVSAATFGGNLEMVWVSRDGTVSAPITAPGRFQDPALSPDGRRVAVAVTGTDEQQDVWLLDLVRGTRTPITSGGANDCNPLFTADGRSIVFESERPVFDLYLRRADGSTPAVPLLASAHDKYPGSITPDGHTLLFDYMLLPNAQIWSVPLADSGRARPVLASATANLHTPRVAPNGRWLAYVSDESGRSEIYLSPYPEVTRARSQVSVDGGMGPRWTRGGRELVYRSANRMMVVSVDPASGALGAPAELFRGDYDKGWNQITSGYDVTRDGSRFLMLRRPAGTAPRQVIVVTNWVQELERLVGR